MFDIYLVKITYIPIFNWLNMISLKLTTIYTQLEH